jgi:hypothetical protein
MASWARLGGHHIAFLSPAMDGGRGRVAQAFRSAVSFTHETLMVEPLQQAIAEGDILGVQVIRITTDFSLAGLEALSLISHTVSHLHARLMRS